MDEILGVDFVSSYRAAPVTDAVTPFCLPTGRSEAAAYVAGVVYVVDDDVSVREAIKANQQYWLAPGDVYVRTRILSSTESPDS